MSRKQARAPLDRPRRDGAPLEDQQKPPASWVGSSARVVLSVAALLALLGGLVAADNKDSRPKGPLAAPTRSRATSPAPELFTRSSFRMLAPPTLVTTCADVAWNTDPTQRAELATAMTSAGLDQRTAEALRRALACPAGGDCASPITPELLLAIPPRARASLYPILGRQNNNSQSAPYHFHGTTERALAAELPELPPVLVSQLFQLTYPERGVSAFADMPALCHLVGLQAASEIVRSINGAPSVRVAVQVHHAADVDALTGYFANPALRPRLEALLATSGATIDLKELLPPLPRELLYTYPTFDEDPRQPRNCFWTALNFFNASPLASYSSATAAQRALADSYVRAPLDELGYGDLLVFEEANGAPVHMAVHVIDDIFLTRNGWNRDRPWTLMSRSDLELRYGKNPASGYRLRAAQRD